MLHISARDPALLFFAITRLKTQKWEKKDHVSRGLLSEFLCVIIIHVQAQLRTWESSIQNPEKPTVMSFFPPLCCDLVWPFREVHPFSIQEFYGGAFYIRTHTDHTSVGNCGVRNKKGCVERRSWGGELTLRLEDDPLYQKQGRLCLRSPHISQHRYIPDTCTLVAG